MKYLIWTTNFAGADGVSTLAALVAGAAAEAADRSGGEVEVRVLTGKGETTREGRVTVAGAGGSRLRFAWFAIRDLFGESRDGDLIILHLHLLPAALPHLLAGRRCRVYLLGIECWVELPVWYGWLLRRCRRVLSISGETIRRFYEANPGLRGLEVRACLLGAGVRPSRERRDEEFALIVGRMAEEERYKGHDELLEVWPEVRRECPAARLVVVGEGSDMERLKGKAARLGVGNAVTFTGRLPEGEMNDLYARCGFFLMPSSNEGFGLVYLEAMRCGKACVGAPGAAEEIIEDGRTGFIVRKDDREGLGAVIVRLFQDRELRESMGAAGRERFLGEFTTARFRERFLAELAS